jgi:hypothetical protein
MGIRGQTKFGVRHQFTKREATNYDDVLFREWCLTPNYACPRIPILKT